MASAVRWKSLKLLMKCPSASYVEKLFEQVFSARHDSRPSVVFLELHASTMRVDQLRLEQLCDAMRHLIARVFSSLPFPFTHEMTMMIVSDVVPSMDSRLVELIAKVITEKSAGWRTRMIQQAPSAPRLIDAKCALCVHQNPNDSVVAVLELDVQSNATVCDVFPATEAIQIRMSKDGVNEMVRQLQRIKDQLALASGSASDPQSVPSVATTTSAAQLAACVAP